MDNQGLWRQEDKSESVFLLLDGHHSRLELPFLNYIHHEEHKWQVCIGVPYGTHVWQFHDASQMNGAFKLNLNAAKRELIDSRSDFGKVAFYATDVVPLVRKAFERSFSNKTRAKKAIAARGWNPLTYNLLDHQNILCDVIAHDDDDDGNDVSNPTSLYNEKSKVARKWFDRIVQDAVRDKGRMLRMK